MSDYKPTPFELAVLAAIISLRDLPHDKSPPENWLGTAHKLLALANDHLIAADPKTSGWRPQAAFLPVGFEKLLRQTPPSDGKKKGRTMLGLITTKAGLFKAIRRVFPNEFKEMCERGFLRRFEIKEIIKNQATLNTAKTQAANLKRAKAVK